MQKRAVKLGTKFGKDWIKNIGLGVEILYLVQNIEIRCKELPFSVIQSTNSYLEITSDRPNVKYGNYAIVSGIGVDSTGAIAPMAKKLWGRGPQVAPTGILLY